MTLEHNFCHSGVKLYLFFILLSLIGCSGTPTQPAPIINGWDKPVSTQLIHQVQRGETFYSVAWRYGKDFRELANINQLKPPYSLHVGQKIHLGILPVHSEKQATRPNIKSSASNKAATSSTVTQKNDSPPPILTSIKPDRHTAIQWQWPLAGKLINSFGATGGKGIDVAAKLGEPVHAAAAGQVVYAGNSLRGYGQLVIIKHNTEFLSAYAHNYKLLVREGELVKAGQAIAEAGDTEADRVMLHVEIRRAGKPVDPLNYFSNSSPDSQ